MDNTIGDNIKRIRLARGLTQEQLGQKAGGRSVNQMNGYERGRSRPSAPILAILAKALGASVADLTGRSLPGGKAGLGQLLADLKTEAAARFGVATAAIRVTVEVIS